MTAPALPGAAPDPVPGHAPGRNDPARLPPEVEEALSLALSDAPARGTCDELLLRTAIRAALDKRGEVSPAAGASARALGGDGEPVAWRRGHRPVGNRAEVEVCETSDLDVDDVIFHDGAWYVVLDSNESDATQVWAAPIVDDAGGQDEPEFCYGEFFVRCVPTRPAATGDTPEVERAARTAALYVDEAWRKGAPKSEWHPIKAMLMRDAIRAATGGHPSEARRGHESEGRGGPDAR